MIKKSKAKIDVIGIYKFTFLEDVIMSYYRLYSPKEYV